MKRTLIALVVSSVLLISGTLISATPLAHAILAPHDLYFLSLSNLIPGFGGAPLSDRVIPENETAFMVTWAKARQLPEMVELGSHGPYSVLIWPYIKRFEVWEEGTESTIEYEMIVVASTLQPDSEGLIHQLVIRFRGGAYNELYVGCGEDACWTDKPMWNLNLDSLDQLTLVKCYADEYALNPMLFEDGKKTIEKLLTQEHIDLNRYSNENYRVDYPFLTLFYGPIAFPYDPSDPKSYVGVTVILNLKTGRIMIAALADLQMNPTGDFSIGWSYTCESRLLYPDRMPAPGIDISYISARAFCQVGDTAKGSIRLELYRLFVSPYPWNDLTVVEVWINDSRQNNTNPLLPAIPTVGRVWRPSYWEWPSWWHDGPPWWYYLINITTGVTLASNYQIRLVFSTAQEFVLNLTVPMLGLSEFTSAFGLEPKIGWIDWGYTAGLNGRMISADLNNDGSVDIFDAVILAGCNGQRA